MQEIFMLVMRLSKMYQIPNFDNINGELLADWIFEEYQHHNLQIVLDSLRKGPPSHDPSWRLTPDTLRTWIELERIKVATARDVEESRKRQEIEVKLEEISPETQKMIQNYLNDLLSGPKPVLPLSRKEIAIEGKERQEVVSVTKAKGYTPPSLEYIQEHELRQRWIKECYDWRTGKPNDGLQGRPDSWMDYEQWKELQ